MLFLCLKVWTILLFNSLTEDELLFGLDDDDAILSQIHNIRLLESRERRENKISNFCTNQYAEYYVYFC